MEAFDSVSPVTQAMLPALNAAGIKAVIRYLSYSPRKNLTVAEAALLSGAGIKCVVVWEAQGDRYSNFTAAQGAKDAASAEQQARALGVPAGATIYFAVDFDAVDDEIANGISDYMRAVSVKLALSIYQPGIYGNGAVCLAMMTAGYAVMAWVWAGTGTNGTLGFMASGRWSIRQHPTVEAFGIEVDPDDLQDPYGGWLLGQNVPVPSLPPPVTPVPAPGPNPIEAILASPSFTAAVESFQHSEGLVEDGIIGRITLGRLWLRSKG